MGLSVVILAAGKGKRMASGLPKVLHRLGGISLLERVVKTAESLKPDAIHVVHGNGGDVVRHHLEHLSVNWVKQEEQLGTGHAVQQALPFCGDDDRVLILYGDVPLISKKTLEDLLESSERKGVGLVVAKLPDPTGMGRIIRNELGNIIRIVEHRDANSQELQIRETNTGIMTSNAAYLKQWLPKLKNANRQKEYYLTDVVALAVEAGYPVGGVVARSFEEVQGVNDHWELAKLERYFQRQNAKRLTLSGATIADPDRFDMRGDDSELGRDVIIDVNVIFEGKVRIGDNVQIGAHTIIKDSTIGDNVIIHSHSIVDQSTIADHSEVGPFARLRPGAVLEEGAKVGNFVEMKKSTLGVGSKANHLTYLGDAIIGKNVNVGAGTITCNYDGVNKWQTQIEDNAFIGSNVSLVAPVTVEHDATVGAGSTITDKAPAKQLAVARARQRNIPNWKRPRKKDD